MPGIEGRERTGRRMPMTPQQPAARRVLRPLSTKALTNRTASGFMRSLSGFMTPPGSNSTSYASEMASASRLSTAPAPMVEATRFAERDDGARAPVSTGCGIALASPLSVITYMNHVNGGSAVRRHRDHPGVGAGPIIEPIADRLRWSPSREGDGRGQGFARTAGLATIPRASALRM